MAPDYQNVYAQMDDGELLALAAEADDLTDEARGALWAELARRGLDAEAARKDPDHAGRGTGERPPPAQLVTVARFDDALSANLAKTKLESQGIPCFLADEHVVQMSWLFSMFAGRIRLQVGESDAGKAADLLWEDEQTRDFLE